MMKYVLFILFGFTLPREISIKKPDPMIPKYPGMSFIQGGTYMMGTDKSTIDSLAKQNGLPADYLLSEYPKHKVKLSSFYIDQ